MRASGEGGGGGGGGGGGPSRSASAGTGLGTQPTQRVWGWGGRGEGGGGGAGARSPKSPTLHSLGVCRGRAGPPYRRGGGPAETKSPRLETTGGRRQGGRGPVQMPARGRPRTRMSPRLEQGGGGGGGGGGAIGLPTAPPQPRRAWTISAARGVGEGGCTRMGEQVAVPGHRPLGTGHPVGAGVHTRPHWRPSRAAPWCLHGPGTVVPRHARGGGEGGGGGRGGLARQ